MDNFTDEEYKNLEGNIIDSAQEALEYKRKEEAHKTVEEIKKSIDFPETHKIEVKDSEQENFGDWLERQKRLDESSNTTYYDREIKEIRPKTDDLKTWIEKQKEQESPKEFHFTDEEWDDKMRDLNNSIAKSDRERRENTKDTSLKLDAVGFVQERNRKEQQKIIEFSADDEFYTEIAEPKYQEVVKNNLEKIKNNSIGNEKKQPCHGEHYVDKNKILSKIKLYLKIAGAILLIYGVFKTAEEVNTLDTYHTYVKNQLEQEYTPKELKEKELPSILEEYKILKDSYKELDKSDYTLGGTKKDGSNPSQEFNKQVDYINITDKEADAIKNAAEKEIEEIRMGGK